MVKMDGRQDFSIGCLSNGRRAPAGARSTLPRIPCSSGVLRQGRGRRPVGNRRRGAIAPDLSSTALLHPERRSRAGTPAAKSRADRGIPVARRDGRLGSRERGGSGSSTAAETRGWSARRIIAPSNRERPAGPLIPDRIDDAIPVPRRVLDDIDPARRDGRSGRCRAEDDEHGSHPASRCVRRPADERLPSISRSCLRRRAAARRPPRATRRRPS